MNRREFFKKLAAIPAAVVGGVVALKVLDKPDDGTITFDNVWDAIDHFYPHKSQNLRIFTKPYPMERGSWFLTNRK